MFLIHEKQYTVCIIHWTKQISIKLKAFENLTNEDKGGWGGHKRIRSPKMSRHIIQFACDVFKPKISLGLSYLAFHVEFEISHNFFFVMFSLRGFFLAFLSMACVCTTKLKINSRLK